MLVRELFCYRPRNDLGIIGHLSEASDDRYVDSSAVVVGAELFEACAEAIVVFCDAECAVKIFRSTNFRRENGSKMKYQKRGEKIHGPFLLLMGIPNPASDRPGL